MANLVGESPIKLGESVLPPRSNRFPGQIRVSAVKNLPTHGANLGANARQVDAEQDNTTMDGLISRRHKSFRGRLGFDGIHETQGACRGAVGLVKSRKKIVANDENYALAA